MNRSIAIPRLALLVGGLLAIGILALGATSRAAHAAAPSRRLDARVDWDPSGVPSVTVRASLLADAALERRLANGLPVTLVVRVVAYDGAIEEGLPIVTHTRACHVAYDAWERRFDVRVEQGEREIASQVSSVEDALVACLDLDRDPIGRRADYRAQRRERVSFALSVDVNPQTRRAASSLSGWLARADGGVGAPTFFGALVGPIAFGPVGAERTLVRCALRARSGGSNP